MASDMTSEDPPVPHGPFPPSWIEESHYYIAFRLRITNPNHALVWYDPHLYPKKVTTGQRDLKGVPQTASPEPENDRTCGFCDLPLELREMVTTFLDNADILSLRATSRAMRSDIGYELNQRQVSLNQDDYIEFTRRLYTDRFARMSKAELLGDKLTADAMLLCGFCLIEHPTSAFAPEEVDKTPFIRACRGALGRFITCECEHSDLSFVQILQQLGAGTEVPNMCPHNYAHTQHQAVPTSLQPQLKRRNSGAELCVRHGFMVERTNSNLPKNSKISERELDMIEQRVSNHYDYICPHLHTSSQNLWQYGIATSPSKWQNFYTRAFEMASSMEPRFRHNRSNWGNLNRYAQCGQAACQTRFGFEHFFTHINVPPGEYNSWLEFRIWRKLGTLEDVQDPFWRAQIETP